MARGNLYDERLAASASVLDVGICAREGEREVSCGVLCVSTEACSRVPRLTLEDKLGLQRVLLPIHLTANDGEERLGIDDDLDPILLDNLIKPLRLVDVLQVIRHARATLVPHAYPNQFGRRRIEQRADAVHRGRRLFGA